MKNNNEIVERIKTYLLNRDDIDFAYLFGSFGGEKQYNLSDIDIAVYTNGNLDILSFGKVVIDLEKICSNKVDLIELNDLHKKNPLLAYEVITKGLLLNSKENRLLTNFKRHTFQNYFDTIKLREVVNTAFYNRLLKNKFGERNYA